MRVKCIPTPSYIDNCDVRLHYSSRAGLHWPEHTHEEHQIIIAAESGASCEISWRTKTGASRTVALPGQNIIYILGGTPHAFRTGAAGSFVSLGVSQALARRFTLGNLWDDVRITQCWRAYRGDLFILGLVDVLREFCQCLDEPDSLDPDLDSLARLLASRLLRLERDRKAITAEGLTPLQLRKVDSYIATHIRDAMSVESLALAAGLKKDHFAHLFKTSTGMSPHCYIIGRRIRHAQNLRKTSALSMAEIAVEAGFCDQSHLGRRIKSHCFRETKKIRRIIPRAAGTSNTQKR